MYIINSSYCLIYNVLMHKLIRFGSRIGSPPDPKIEIHYLINNDILNFM